jgi:serine/threonine protein kinase
MSDSPPFVPMSTTATTIMTDDDVKKDDDDVKDDMDDEKLPEVKPIVDFSSGIPFVVTIQTTVTTTTTHKISYKPVGAPEEEDEDDDDDEEMEEEEEEEEEEDVEYPIERASDEVIDFLMKYGKKVDDIREIIGEEERKYDDDDDDDDDDEEDEEEEEIVHAPRNVGRHTLTSTKEVVIVKTLPFDSLNKDNPELLENEYLINKYLEENKILNRHAPLLYVYYDDWNIYYLFEYINSTTVFSLDEGDDYQQQMYRNFLPMVKNLLALHEHKILWYDIKTDNVLTDIKTKEWVFIDFEWSRFSFPTIKETHPRRRTEYNDPLFVFWNRLYDNWSEIYSLGVLFAEVLLNRILYTAREVHNLLEKQYTDCDDERRSDRFLKLRKMQLLSDYDTVREEIMSIECPPMNGFDADLYGLINVCILYMIHPVDINQRFSLESIILAIEHRDVKWLQHAQPGDRNWEVPMKPLLPIPPISLPQQEDNKKKKKKKKKLNVAVSVPITTTSGSKEEDKSSEKKEKEKSIVIIEKKKAKK